MLYPAELPVLRSGSVADLDGHCNSLNSIRRKHRKLALRTGHGQAEPKNRPHTIAPLQGKGAAMPSGQICGNQNTKANRADLQTVAQKG